MKDLPLNCRVENGTVTITIGVNTLAFATKIGLESQGDWPEDAESITCAEGFCQYILDAMNTEREDGSTKLTDLLDWAALEALEQGSQHVSYPA